MLPRYLHQDMATVALTESNQQAKSFSSNTFQFNNRSCKNQQNAMKCILTGKAKKPKPIPIKVQIGRQIVRQLDRHIDHVCTQRHTCTYMSLCAMLHTLHPSFTLRTTVLLDMLHSAIEFQVPNLQTARKEVQRGGAALGQSISTTISITAYH